jgi:hypothetical protein
VPPLDARNQRRGGRARGGSVRGPIEALERREVLSYSTLGYSLPNLNVTGLSAPVAAWGQPLAVAVNVYNTGASTINEPLHLTPGSVSTADAPASTLYVFASNRPHGHKQVLIGSINVPAIHENDVVSGTQSFLLPARPAGFPGNGGHIFLTYSQNPTRAFTESQFNNNTFVSPQPVTIAPALPNLQLVNFTVPGSLQPGDTIQPSIQIANIGAADTARQGPVTVQIVASETPTFGPGDAILATYTVPNIAALASTPSLSANLANANLQPGNNTVTLSDQIITLPSTPGTYYLGVKINPLNTIHETGQHRTPKFDAIVKVGPAIPGVPPSTDLLTGTMTTLGQFPFPLGANNAGVTVGGTSIGTTTVGSVQSAEIKNANGSNLTVFNAPAKPKAPSQTILFKASAGGNQTGSTLYNQVGFPGGLTRQRTTPKVV